MSDLSDTSQKVLTEERSTKKNSKRLLFALIAVVGVILFLVLLQADNSEQQKRAQEQKDARVRGSNDSSFLDALSRMQADAAKMRQKPKPELPQPTAKGQDRTILIRQQRQPDPPKTYAPSPTVRQASDQMRNMRMAAISSKSSIQGFNEVGKQSGQADQSSQSGSSRGDSMALLAAQQGGNPGEAPYEDFNKQMHKEEFLRGKAASLTPQGYSANLPLKQQFRYELKAGSLIPAILVTAVNSDMPGNIIGQVSENVYDTSSGRFLLIPKGTRIVGVYSSQVSFGQNRVLVVWNRLVFPDGTTLNIAGTPGIDQGGSSGLRGRVNEHWDQMIKAALLASAFVVGAEVLYPSEDNNSTWGNNDKKSPGEIASEQVATAILNVGNKLIDRAMSIQPTITIKSGYRFNLFVQQDLIFPETYKVPENLDRY